jgi:hypothetical protein
MYTRLRLPWGYAYPRLKTTGIKRQLVLKIGRQFSSKFPVHFPKNTYKSYKVNMSGTLKSSVETGNSYRNFVKKFALKAIVWEAQLVRLSARTDGKK